MSRYMPYATFSRFNVSPVRPTGSLAPYHKTIYGPNGTGRDSYISRNNGGLCNYTEGVVRLDGGSFRSLTPDLINTDLRPRFEPKKAFYHYDGTGRDTYIGYQSDHTFVDHLRDYESPSPMSRVSNSRQGGVSVKSGHYSQEYLSRLRTLQAYQKMRSFRLAEPKKRRPKFTNLFIHKPKQSVRTENSEKTRKNT